MHGDGGGGRRLAKEIGILGRGLKDLLIVFLTGLIGGRGSRSFGNDSSHLEVLIELDREIFDCPVVKDDGEGGEAFEPPRLKFRGDGSGEEGDNIKEVEGSCGDLDGSARVTSICRVDDFVKLLSSIFRFEQVSLFEGLKDFLYTICTYNPFARF